MKWCGDVQWSLRLNQEACGCESVTQNDVTVVQLRFSLYSGIVYKSRDAGAVPTWLWCSLGVQGACLWVMVLPAVAVVVIKTQVWMILQTLPASSILYSKFVCNLLMYFTLGMLLGL